MQKLKVYLESTMFNYYFDVDRDAHLDTVEFFEECKAGDFEAYTSDYVIEELDAAPEDKRSKMLALIEQYKIAVLPASEEADSLAQRYIADGTMPGGSLVDARHIAIAPINSLDIVVSLNFQHIVKSRTVQFTGAINIIMGLKPQGIYSPMEVLSSEKTRYHLG